MHRLLIIKTGNTVKSVPARRGDFEHWIATGMGLTPDRVHTVRVHENESLPEPNGLAGVVITGSPAMVTDRAAWITEAEIYVRRLRERKIPLLGICFGHQLIAQALGGHVDYHPGGREIGTTTMQFTEYASGDPLCRGLSGKIPIHVSHSQSVLRLPENARILAANAFEPHQAVRFADSVWGVQFHPEFDADIMRAYIRERKQALTAEGLAADDLYQQVRDTHEAASILTNFAELITSYEPD